MIEGQPSATAERVAAERAAHQLLDSPTLLDDPIQLSIIAPERREKLLAEPAAHDRSPLSRPMRAIVVVRSRIAEDEMRRRYDEGVRQYVVLGAGLDTFAYRHALPDLRVFEVDQPSTQGLKKARLAAASIAVPASLAFVPCDFTTQRIPDTLAAAGFAADRPAVFAWLGVAMYLEERDVDATLSYVGSLARKTSIIFDYAQPPDSLAWLARIFYRKVLDRLAERGEPWKSFLEPARLRAKLLQMGFDDIDDLGADEINARYLANRTDGLRSGGVGRVAIARK